MTGLKHKKFCCLPWIVIQFKNWLRLRKILLLFLSHFQNIVLSCLLISSQEFENFVVVFWRPVITMYNAASEESKAQSKIHEPLLTDLWYFRISACEEVAPGINQSPGPEPRSLIFYFSFRKAFINVLSIRQEWSRQWSLAITSDGSSILRRNDVVYWMVVWRCHFWFGSHTIGRGTVVLFSSGSVLVFCGRRFYFIILRGSLRQNVLVFSSSLWLYWEPPGVVSSAEMVFVTLFSSIVRTWSHTPRALTGPVGRKMTLLLSIPKVWRSADNMFNVTWFTWTMWTASKAGRLLVFYLSNAYRGPVDV